MSSNLAFFMLINTKKNCEENVFFVLYIQVVQIILPDLFICTSFSYFFCSFHLCLEEIVLVYTVSQVWFIYHDIKYNVHYKNLNIYPFFCI